MPTVKIVPFPGVAGPTGPQGATGATGPQGEQGPAGSSIGNYNLVSETATKHLQVTGPSWSELFVNTIVSTAPRLVEIVLSTRIASAGNGANGVIKITKVAGGQETTVWSSVITNATTTTVIAHDVSPEPEGTSVSYKFYTQGTVSISGDTEDDYTQFIVKELN